MSFLMSTGNILSLLDFHVIGSKAQMILFKHLKNGCLPYFTPDVGWACEQVVPEDMNDARYVDVSDLLSVAGNCYEHVLGPYQ